MRLPGIIFLLVGLIGAGIAAWRFFVERARFTRRVPTEAEVVSIEVEEQRDGDDHVGTFRLRGVARVGGKDIRIERLIWSGKYAALAKRYDELKAPGKHLLSIDPDDANNADWYVEETVDDHLASMIVGIIAAVLLFFGLFFIVPGPMFYVLFFGGGALSLVLAVPATLSTARKAAWPTVAAKVMAADVVLDVQQGEKATNYYYKPREWLGYEVMGRGYSTPLLVGPSYREADDHGTARKRAQADSEQVVGKIRTIRYNPENPYEIITSPGWALTLIAPGLGILFLGLGFLIRRLAR